jgi:hypothetical protein
MILLIIYRVLKFRIDYLYISNEQYKNNLLSLEEKKEKIKEFLEDL